MYRIYTTIRQCPGAHGPSRLILTTSTEDGLRILLSTYSDTVSRVELFNEHPAVEVPTHCPFRK